MKEALLWTFFVADAAGVAWCVGVLAREVRQHLAWRTETRYGRPPTIELPDDFVLIPAQRRAHEPAAQQETAPVVRLVS